jgi:hypothetical protein
MLYRLIVIMMETIALLVAMAMTDYLAEEVMINYQEVLVQIISTVGQEQIQY